MNFLIWSNQHQQWWRANGSGYTGYIEEAGRYTEGEAKKVVADATIQGQLVHTRVDPVTNRVYQQFDEVMVRAPEESS